MKLRNEREKEIKFLYGLIKIITSKQISEPIKMQLESRRLGTKCILQPADWLCTSQCKPPHPYLRLPPPPPGRDIAGHLTSAHF